MNLVCMLVLTLMKLHQSPVVASPLRIQPSQLPIGLSEADHKFSEEYMQHFYGYQPKSDRQKRAADYDEDSDWTTGLCDKVKEMQRFFGLPPDGELNKETLAVMKKPRCGLSDVEPYGSTFRWTKRTVSYSKYKERGESTRNIAYAKLSACPPSNTVYHLEGTPRCSHQPAKLSLPGSSSFTYNQLVLLTANPPCTYLLKLTLISSSSSATCCGLSPAGPETVTS
ncbi:hypothetical protein CHARACLAT_015531 [Characodon lateralis]|uniref:Peptidoglycan binding-like domain-containing protein n=1 Tax=Characodon lateralis TaxID=208331 RepID=A0ABU7D0Z0_9TELE|nr:hypothetical protein [Characodon lateralis]